MWPFYLLLLVIFSAFSVVMKIIWDEHRKETGEAFSKKKEDPVKPTDVLERSGLASESIQKPVVTASASSMLEKAQSLLGQLLKKKGPSASKKEQLLSPEEISNLTNTGLQQTGTASIRLDPKSGKPAIRIQNPQQEPKPASVTTPPQQPPVSRPGDRGIDREVELSIQNDELKNELAQLQERYDKLDRLFIEKSSSLEKTLKDLEHEQKNRKEFNKVKDVLEREIKDSKAVAKKAEAELNSIKSESSSYTNRITQLEEKIKRLEGELYAKDDTLEEQNKKIAQLAAAAPIKTPPPDTTATDTTPQAKDAGEGELPLKEAAIEETPSPEEKPREEKPQDETQTPQGKKPLEEEQQHSVPSETAQQTPDQGSTAPADDANTKTSVQPPVYGRSKKDEPLAISASQEYLSLLGETSFSGNEDNADDQTINESSGGEPSEDLQNDAAEPQQPATADEIPEPAAPEKEPLEEEPSDEPVSDESARSRSFDELLLKPLGQDEEQFSLSKTPAENDFPAAAEADNNAITDEDDQTERDETATARPSDNGTEDIQDLPEPPPPIDQEAATVQTQNNEQSGQHDDLPLPAEPITESTGSFPSEREVEQQESLEPIKNADEPSSQELPEHAAEIEPDDPDDEPDEKHAFNIPDDNDPDRPHLKPDIFKDILTPFEPEDNNKPPKKDTTEP